MLQNANSIARKAIVAGLGLALSCETFLGLPRSAKAETPQASITINQKYNETATYDAYQLFEADVAEDDEASHVTWASPAMQELLLSYLDANGYLAWIESSHPGNGQHERAQNALEFIAEMISDSPEDPDAKTTPRTTVGGSFANELAQYLAESGATSRQATTGSPFTGSEGYWLFVTANSDAGDEDEAATAPIWVALGGSITTINEKTALPTLQKQIKEDSAGDAWGKTADANIGQEVSYRLVGTLPSNFASYESFHYRFEDTLSEGLDLVTAEGANLAESLGITIDGKAVAPGDGAFDVTWSDHVLAIDFANLKSTQWQSFALHGGTEIAVEYKAKLNGSAKLGSAGNENTVGLIYTNDPIRNTDGRITPPPSPRLYAYGLQLLKVDEQTGEPLSDAAFTIQVAEGNSDSASTGKYVQSDGSLGDAPHEFVTDESGLIIVSGIDEGTYTVSETRTPAGYERIDSDVTVMLRSTTDDAAISLVRLEAEVSGGDSTDAANTHRTEISDIDTAAGVVSVSVTNDRNLTLPITGMTGAGGIAGTIVALATGTTLWLRRRTLR